MLRSTQSFEAEVEELKLMMRCSYSPPPPPCNSISTAEEGRRKKGGFLRVGHGDDDEGAAGTTVCVTSGISFLGFAVANRLLSRGYTVRLLLDTQG